MRLILILFLAMGVSVPALSASKKSKSKIKHSKMVAQKRPAKMSEAARKRLAKRQVAHARRIASLQKEKEAKAAEVTILDHGFVQPTNEEIPEPVVQVISEDIKAEVEDGYAPPDAY